MDDAGWQIARPVRGGVLELARDVVGETLLHRIGAAIATLVELLPALERQRVGPLQLESGAGQVHAREIFADRPAMIGMDALGPHALEETDDRRGAPGQLADHLAVLAVDRRRAGDAGA